MAKVARATAGNVNTYTANRWSPWATSNEAHLFGELWAGIHPPDISHARGHNSARAPTFLLNYFNRSVLFAALTKTSDPVLRMTFWSRNSDGLKTSSK
jgi:hypothetical protein